MRAQDEFLFVSCAEIAGYRVAFMSKIWIVDDDEEMIRAVQLMVRLLRHDTVIHSSALAAVQALQGGERPDVMLLDIIMPRISGLDLLRFMRQHEEYVHIPVIILSTEAAEITVDKALELGADAYILKPVILEEMQQAIEKAISAHGA